jgi:hypothetical protein
MEGKPYMERQWYVLKAKNGNYICFQMEMIGHTYKDNVMLRANLLSIIWMMTL